MSKEYQFHTWRQVKVWKKECYTVWADSEEEAINKAKTAFNNEELYEGVDGCIEWTDSDFGDDEEFVEWSDGNTTTYELWIDDDGAAGHLQEPLLTNKPIEVVREEKINKLLDFK